MTGKQLKNAILQLAIQGKLVPQDANDEPASVLLAKIHKEKEQLVKAGKLKKKDLESTPITDEEKPFEIPEAWEWCRLGDIYNIYSAMRIHQTDWKTHGVPFFRGRELVQLIKTGSVTPEIFISEELYKEKSEKSRLPQKDDILITAVGSIGQTYIVKGTNRFYYKDAYILCLHDFGVLYPKYIKMVLDSPQLQQEIHHDSLKTTVAQLTIIKANNLMIPLPPLSEQRRIVAKIEELMPLVEEYGVAQEKLNHLNEALPEALKKSILQQGIQGKLVPQDTKDEPASALLVQIRKEKEQLLKAGKLKKKDLATTPIADDEKPFEIPESWEWVRLGEITDVLGGYAFQSQDIKGEKGTRVIRISDFNENGWVNNKIARYNDKEQLNQFEIKINDILLAMTGGTVGKSFFIENLPERMLLNQRVALIRSLKAVPKFVDLLIKSPLIQNIINERKNSTNDNISMGDITGFVIPLPPLAEQKRIVMKIEELMALVDGMKG